MTNNAKAEFRKKTFELIEQLDEQADNLTVAAELDSELGVPLGISYEKSIGQECTTWPIHYRVSKEDPSTQVFLDTLEKVYNMINSKEAVRAYPRGLYRELIDFSDKCAEIIDWVLAQHNGAASLVGTESPQDEDIYKDARSLLKSRIERRVRIHFKGIRRAILFFENERDESEESFIDY